MINGGFLGAEGGSVYTQVAQLGQGPWGTKADRQVRPRGVEGMIGSCECLNQTLRIPRGFRSINFCWNDANTSSG